MISYPPNPNGKCLRFFQFFWGGGDFPLASLTIPKNTKRKSIAANLYYYNVQYGVLSIAWCMFGISHMFLLEGKKTLDIDSL